MRTVAIICIMIFLSSNSFSQDTLLRKNIISIIPTNLALGSLAVSYNRVVKKNREICIRLNLSKSIPNLFRYDIAYIFEDPFWYSNHARIQGGILFQDYNTTFEPSLLYEYGYFKNETICIHDEDGGEYDEYWRLDRNYHAIGSMFLLGYSFDLNRIRLKFFGGGSVSLKFYEQQIHAINGRINEDNTKTNYYKVRPSIKAGIEIGYIF